MQSIIEINDLGKKYLLGQQQSYLSLRDVVRESFRKRKAEQHFWALRNVNLKVEKGDRLAIIGNNGAGKSTLLKILSRITKPTEGEAIIRGRMASLLEVGTGFHPELTGRENIFLNGSILGLKKNEILRQFDAIVSFSELEAFLDVPLKNYSTGMQLRLAFSVAAHLEPEILVVDEVLAVGDISFQAKCLQKMNDIAAGSGRTILFVSHNMAALQQLCNKSVVLKNGTIAYEGGVMSGIDFYIAGTKQTVASTEPGLFDMKRHPDKKNYEVGLTNVKMSVNGIVTNIFIPGQNLRFDLFFSSDSILIDPEIGIVIKNDKYEPIIGLNNKHIGAKLEINKGNFQGIIQLPGFNLFKPGRYFVDIFLGDYYSFYESLHNCMEFNVEHEDVYKIGLLLDPKFNQIVIPNASISAKKSTEIL